MEVWDETGTASANTSPTPIKAIHQRTSVSPCTEENERTDDRLRREVVSRHEKLHTNYCTSRFDFGLLGKL
jgi:hypothetical protein